ncbi:uncharacterized protein LOC125375982 [Haliotis rufescens]|uniref:uncharacterized protein LOC125375982 n=1 Tax=Haliotis rufescens TaxID=6454 RepID=UPI00201F86D7|nr:uncharacterized protein LOC125375982 [Haliotis rufescens]
MCKADITDAFKQIPLSLEYWPYFGFKWEGLYYFYTRLAFGCRSSPKIFDPLSQAICWILKHNHDFLHVLHLLDDFLVIDPPGHDAESTMSTILSLFKRLNIPLALHKTQGPLTEIEYLGIILDSNLMTARLPQDKLQRIAELLGRYSTKRSCTKRELLSLLEHLNYACRVIVPGRTFVSYLIELSMLACQAIVEKI